MAKLIVIAGPTGVGKTDLAIKVAKKLKTVILSSDSRQFYKELSIGTAKPSEKQLNAVKHYFINSLSITQDYSAGKFETEAIDLLNTLFKSYPTIIMTGGSGLYIDAVCNGFNSNLSGTNKEIRKTLETLYNKYGINILKQKLFQIDKLAYEKIDINNPKRIIRAIEVYIDKQTSFTNFKSDKKKRAFEVVKFVINKPTEILYPLVNKRVDNMIKEGLIEEVRSVKKYKSLSALKTLGYKEIFDYFDEKLSQKQAIEKIKTNTRRYTKKQLNWFKRDSSYQWIDTAEGDKKALSAIISC